MKLLNNKAKKEAIGYLLATKDKIAVRPGMCRYNFRCQYNAVHDAIDRGDERIAMSVYVDSGYPIIHFLNVDEKGEFVDNTLGNWADRNEYYLVKYITKDDFFAIDTFFDEYRKELRKRLSFFTRLFSDYNF